MDGEQIAVWHACLCTIFERPFPGEDIQGSRLLINKFVLKLADSNIRQWTHRANPATYNAAITAASNEAASQSILAHEAGTGGKGNIAINAFGGRRGACHGCGSYEHHIKVPTDEGRRDKRVSSQKEIWQQQQQERRRQWHRGRR
jgi:excinuclease UvrABC ATPase subunit